MSLADELLADLEEMGEGQGPSSERDADQAMETEQVTSAVHSLPNKNSVHAVAKL